MLRAWPALHGNCWNLQDIPQFAYQANRGLSDALDRVVHHLREARDLLASSRPARHERKEGATRPELVGGITFALDLSQAFDTVSRQEIIDQLLGTEAPASLVRLVQALHQSSSYRVKSQGNTAQVETTTGIKQGCKLSPTLFAFLTGGLFQSLLDAFGVDQVVEFLTGYADDFTMHRAVRQPKDLQHAHRLIAALLAEVARHNLRVNTSKCVVLVRLAGSMAPGARGWYDDTPARLRTRKVTLSRDGALAQIKPFRHSSGSLSANTSALSSATATLSSRHCSFV